MVCHSVGHPERLGAVVRPQQPKHLVSQLEKKIASFCGHCGDVKFRLAPYLRCCTETQPVGVCVCACVCACACVRAFDWANSVWPQRQRAELNGITVIAED